MLRRTFIGVFAAALLASPSSAIVSDPMPRICNEFRQRDYVFTGVVLTEANSWPKRLHGDGVAMYRIKVDQVFKGEVPHIARLFTGLNSGRGVLKAGQRAVVFAGRYDGRMYFSGSSNTVSGADSRKVIPGIREYLKNPPKLATISGRIDGWYDPSRPRTGPRILITNGATKRFVPTDRRGRFFVTVQPGNWSAQIAESGWASRSGVYSYDDADKIRLVRGGCADVQIETAPPGGELMGIPHWKKWAR